MLLGPAGEDSEDREALEASGDEDKLCWDLVLTILIKSMAKVQGKSIVVSMREISI